MKITIDTKEDSAEEIKKIIGFLNNFVEGSEIVSNKDIFEQPDVPQENVLGNVFDVNKDKEEPEEIKPIEQEEPTEEKKDSEVQIIY